MRYMERVARGEQDAVMDVRSQCVELPIFSPGHADFARHQASLRQAQYLSQSMAIDARSEIRVGRERLLAARRKVEYYISTVLPRNEAIVQLSLEQYNGVQIGTFQLLDARAELLRRGPERVLGSARRARASDRRRAHARRVSGLVSLWAPPWPSYRALTRCCREEDACVTETVTMCRSLSRCGRAKAVF